MNTTDRTARTRRRDRLATFAAAGLAALPLMAGAGVSVFANDILASPVPDASASAAATPGVGLGTELIEDLRDRGTDRR